MSEDYSTDLQKLYIEFLLADKDLFVRCNAILKSDYFDRQFRDTVEFVQKHVEEYSDVPMLEQVRAISGVDVQDVKDRVNDEHRNWFMDNFEQFCRHKALEGAILASADKLERKEYGTVDGLIKEAVEIFRWFLPLLELDINPKLVQNIKLAESILEIGSEHVRLPRKPLYGKEREEVLSVIKYGISNRPDLTKYNY